MALVHRERGEPFAIRSGGHGLSAGAANIKDGVTVDLRSISTVEVLDPLNIIVTGGCDAAIGAGGFLTGGGIGVPSVTAGWGCDDVLEYEIVVASGEILRVSADRHPDLFVALKGGLNNFGVVTQFTMRTHPIGKLWAGFTAYPGADAPRLLAAYLDFMEPANRDPHVGLIELYGWTRKHAAVYATLILLYSLPHPYPAVYQNLIDNSTVLYNTLRAMNEVDSEESGYIISRYNRRRYSVMCTMSPRAMIYGRIKWIISAEPSCSFAHPLSRQGRGRSR